MTSVFVLGYWLAGCGGARRAVPALAIRKALKEGDERRASVTQIRGDWNDLDAAVRVGAEACEWAITDREAGGKVRGGREVTFRLRSNTGDRGTLTARVAAGAGEENVAIEMECRVGLFGDDERERQLLELIARRFEQLRGVVFAPVGE